MAGPPGGRLRMVLSLRLNDGGAPGRTLADGAEPPSERWRGPRADVRRWCWTPAGEPRLSGDSHGRCAGGRSARKKPGRRHLPPTHRIGPNHTHSPPEERRMPGITREEVAHLARLARLELKGEELDHFAGQLDDIIGAVARVSEV